MAQQLQILPAARQTYNVHNQGTVLNWELVAPRGKVIEEIRLDARINLAGVVVAARFHKAINSIKVVSDKGSVLEALQDAIPTGVLATHALKEDNYYEVSPSNTDIVRNPSVAAAATNYDASYRFHAPLPGSRFTVLVDIAAMITAFGATVTGATTDWSVYVKWTDYKPGMGQYMILIDRVTNFTNKKYKNVVKAALFNANEWNSVLGTVKIGKALANPQISMNEDLANDQLRGLSTNGVSVATRTLPVLDPATAADVFCLMDVLDDPGEVEIQPTSAQSMSAVLYTMAGRLELLKVESQT
jgi:hypothetical protein